MRWIFTALAVVLVIFCATRCASMPPSVKIIEQVTKNDDAIEEIEESDLPAPVKARAVSAIKDTQNLAVQASQAWEQCKDDLASESLRKWQWAALAGAAAGALGFFVGRKL
jgi:uncharacterized protein with von Willebrand factor type A (vWA) domain